MTSQEIREKFLRFFEERGHVIVPSSSLIPDDPSVLLTTAGMQQFKKYYTGEADATKDFGMLNTVSIQKSFRTSDIDEVGDDSHLTFFEMLGNFSFGGYFKKEAITYAHEFITKEMDLTIDYVTVFRGKSAIPEDVESNNIWRSIDSSLDIRLRGVEDNFWGPTGNKGPCGPTTEIYVNGVEIWNIVFNQYYQNANHELSELKIKGIDTGMGLERLAMAAQGKKNIFETDLFAPLIGLLPTVEDKSRRIIIDHLRGAIFLIVDGVQPSNKERGYILRRLLRRAFVQIKLHASLDPQLQIQMIINMLIDLHQYSNFYSEIKDKKILIDQEIEKEYQRFNRSSDAGLKEFLKKFPDLRPIADNIERDGGYQSQYHERKRISGNDAFYFYESYGLTFDIMRDLAIEGMHEIDEKEFEEAMHRHQELSRTGQEKKFGGHGLLLDTGELKAADEKELKIVTRLHTATHLLQAALRKVLGQEVSQQGSDITAERTRFDFSFSRKLTPEEIKQVEDMVNQAVERDYTVEFKEMPYEDAIKSGALHFFREKYPPMVKVYSVYDPKTGEVFSREFCGGPHVTHTGEIGKIKIFKEEASSAGIRRIRASVTP